MTIQEAPAKGSKTVDWIDTRQISRIEIKPGKGVAIRYEQIINSKGDKNTVTLRSKYPPVEAFQAKFDSLRGYVIEYCKQGKNDDITIQKVHFKYTKEWQMSVQVTALKAVPGGTITITSQLLYEKTEDSEGTTFIAQEWVERFKELEVLGIKYLDGQRGKLDEAQGNLFDQQTDSDEEDTSST